MTEPLRVISYGGGVQSTALLVLAAEGRIDYRTFLFANVGDDSENPATVAYVRDHAGPFAEAHGLEIHELQKRRRGGDLDTLLGQIGRVRRSVPFPMRMPDTGAPGNRSCTSAFKIEVVARWTRAAGATAEEPAQVGIGISLDEISRVNSRRRVPHEEPTYPLLDIPAGTTGLRLDRSACAELIRRAGLPVPPKSACWFCPMHRPSEWADMRRREPVLFARAADLEAQMIARRGEMGRDPLYLTRFGVPLAEAIPDAPVLFELDDDGCDSGYCFT